MAARFGISRLTGLMAKSSRRREAAAKKAAELYQAAKGSVGLKQTWIADRSRLKMYLEEVKHSEKQLKDIEKQMKRLLEEVPYAKSILSIHGVGVLSCAVLLGELGDPSNFNNPKQIIKYTGYDPQENDSGKA